MRQLGALGFLLVLACASAACDGFVLFVSTGPLPPAHSSPTAPVAPRPIVVGEVVRTTFIVPEVCFDVTPAVTGNLFVFVSWDRREGDIDLTLGSSVFTLAAVSASSADVSLVGTMRVAAGQSYRVTVAGERGPVPFTLRTSVE
jgi:hypothetical protein